MSVSIQGAFGYHEIFKFKLLAVKGGL